MKRTLIGLGIAVGLVACVGLVSTRVGAEEPKIDICHFPGHTSEFRRPDYATLGRDGRHCELDRGNLITVACAAAQNGHDVKAALKFCRAF